MKKREITLPTILGLLLAVVGLVSGLWLVQKQLRQSAVAAAQESPQEVKITNTSESGFTVSWITEKETAGFIQYGEGTIEPDLVISDDRDQQKGSVENFSTHHVNIKGLKPATTYSFKIGSGRNVYELQGKPYSVTTAPRLTVTPEAYVGYGQVITESGDPAEGAIVYLQMPGSVLQSALVKPSGAWVIPLSTSRTSDLSRYIDLGEKNMGATINVQAGAGRTALMVSTVDKLNPAKEITLGNTYNDVDTETVARVTQTPEPQNEIIPPGETEELSILTPKTGELVNSSRPEIVGNAPAGTEVTIEVNSETRVSQTITSDENGKFSFTVPVELQPGEHTVTVTAIIDGITRKITKAFTVYAANESSLPAYSATPSGTITPTLRPSPTVRPPSPTPTTKLSLTPTMTPGITISPTMTPSPTPEERVVIPSTESGRPVSGNGTGTLIMVALGLMLTMGGILRFRKTV